MFFSIFTNIKDKEYSDWIKSLPCAFCGKPGPSQQHHIRNLDGPTGTGIKPSDYVSLPACDLCHKEDQQYKGRYNKEQKMRFIIKHLSEFIQKCKKK